MAQNNLHKHYLTKFKKFSLSPPPLSGEFVFHFPPLSGEEQRRGFLYSLPLSGGESKRGFYTASLWNRTG
jgi:hypothetical protein